MPVVCVGVTLLFAGGDTGSSFLQLEMKTESRVTHTTGKTPKTKGKLRREEKPSWTTDTSRVVIGQRLAFKSLENDFHEKSIVYL